MKIDTATMKRGKGSCKTAGAATPGATPAKVSIRTIYAEAMRDVMADPRKAIAEHDPWLSALLNPGAATPAKN